MRRLMVGLVLGMLIATLPGGVAGASKTPASYTYTGIDTTACEFGRGCPPMPPRTDTVGTLSGCVGAGCTTGPSPATATMDLGFLPPHFPPHECNEPKVGGTLQIRWADSTMSTASVHGNTRKGAGILVNGVVASGPFSGRHLKATLSVSQPLGPCDQVTSTFTGSLLFK
jgi:hypothetical protein